MVERQIAGRGIRDSRLLDAMRSVPRELFVPEHLASLAPTAHRVGFRSTATIMFAFLPLMMIGGTSGQFIRVLPTAVLVTVGASRSISENVAR